MKSACIGQCHGCAFKPGAAANREPQNLLRGVLAALGGLPFFCHDSMGWKGRRGGYAKDSLATLSVLMLKPKLVQAGIAPAALTQAVEMQRDLRICGGWKAAVRRLRDAGWFRNAGVRLVRRYYASHALACLGRLGTNPDTLMPDDRRERNKDFEDIEESMRWFGNEAREAGTDIGWLLGPKDRDVPLLRTARRAIKTPEKGACAK